MSIKKNINFRKAFDKEKMILSWFGLYPCRNSNKKFVYPRIIICCTLITTQIIGMLMLFVVNDIRSFVNASHFVIINVTLICKLSIFLSSGDKFEHIENHLNNIKAEDVPDDVANYIAKEEYSRNQLGFPQRFMVLGGLLFSICLCLLLRKYRPLIFISWTPFDLQDPKFYYSVLIFQTMAFISSGLPNSSMDITYYVLVDVACAQMDILMYNLSHLNTKNSCESIFNDIRKKAVYHCQIMRFIRVIQGIYSKIIFAQCIGSVIVICILGFQLAVTVKFPSTEFVTQGLFFGSMIFQIFCYCWFGQKFLLKSQEVARACYMSKWNECDKKTKKMISIIMTRSTNPVVLTAGIFTLTLETFITILRSSYSYMAVLNTMYSK